MIDLRKQILALHAGLTEADSKLPQDLQDAYAKSAAAHAHSAATEKSRNPADHNKGAMLHRQAADALQSAGGGEEGKIRLPKGHANRVWDAMKDHTEKETASRDRASQLRKSAVKTEAVPGAPVPAKPLAAVPAKPAVASVPGAPAAKPAVAPVPAKPVAAPVPGAPAAPVPAKPLAAVPAKPAVAPVPGAPAAKPAVAPVPGAPAAKPLAKPVAPVAGAPTAKPAAEKVKKPVAVGALPAPKQEGLDNPHELSIAAFDSSKRYKNSTDPGDHQDLSTLHGYARDLLKKLHPGHRKISAHEAMMDYHDKKAAQHRKPKIAAAQASKKSAKKAAKQIPAQASESLTWTEQLIAESYEMTERMDEKER